MEMLCENYEHAICRETDIGSNFKLPDLPVVCHQVSDLQVYIYICVCLSRDWLTNLTTIITLTQVLATHFPFAKHTSIDKQVVLGD